MIGRITIDKVGWALQPKTKPTEIHLPRTIDPSILPTDFDTQIDRTTFHFENGNTEKVDELFIIQAERNQIWDQILAQQNDLPHLHELLTIENNPTPLPSPQLTTHTQPEIKDKFFEIYNKYKENIAAKHQYDLGKIQNFEFKLTLKG